MRSRVGKRSPSSSDARGPTRRRRGARASMPAIVGVPRRARPATHRRVVTTPPSRGRAAAHPRGAWPPRTRGPRTSTSPSRRARESPRSTARHRRGAPSGSCSRMSRRFARRPWSGSLLIGVLGQPREGVDGDDPRCCHWPAPRRSLRADRCTIDDQRRYAESRSDRGKGAHTLFETSRSGDDGTPVWHLKGELDLATAGEVKEAFDDWLHTARLVPTLTLDLRGAHLHRQLRRPSHLRAHDGARVSPVVLLDPGDVVRRVFKIVGLDQHPKIQLVNR